MYFSPTFVTQNTAAIDDQRSSNAGRTRHINYNDRMRREGRIHVVEYDCVRKSIVEAE